jgi:hypothetical protein
MIVLMTPPEDNRDYCRRRAAEERAAAAHAADDRAAQAHLDLARHFESLACHELVESPPDQLPYSPSTLPGEFRIIP